MTNSEARKIVQTSTELAITFDDGPFTMCTPVLNARERNIAILQSLQKYQITAALFVTLCNGADTSEGYELAKMWRNGGHVIGNHTADHLNLNATTTSILDFQRSILDCEERLLPLMLNEKYFRFPYLKEGDTTEKRLQMCIFLKNKNYFNARVTIDTSDWRLNEHLIATLEQDPGANIEHYRRLFLSHILHRVHAYSSLSMALFNRVVPMVMLLHHNLINALFMDDLIQMLKDDGCNFVDMRHAYVDTFYDIEPENLVAGQSLLLSIAHDRKQEVVGLTRLMDNGDTEIAELNQLYKSTLQHR
jgi:peptidoglycan/xylan/chitin deacetylase (PgdA/CDA1 family)